MKYSKLFLYWLLTNIIGSYIMGVVDFLFYNKNIVYSDFLKDTIEFIPLTSIFSALFSIPALIVFFALNSYYKRRILSKNFMLLGQLIISVITFSLMISFNYPKQIDFTSICFLSYTTVGLLFWFFEFRKIESKSS